MMTESSPRPEFVRSRKFYVGIILVAALVLSSWYGASQYLRHLYPANSTSSANSASVNVMFSYGNGSTNWFSSTLVPRGSSFYNTTLSLTGGRLQAKYYDTFHGHFRSSINAVKNRVASDW